jgi:hypothetical protein
VTRRWPLVIWWRAICACWRARRLVALEQRRRELLGAVDPLSVQWLRDERYARGQLGAGDKH